jgi:hypothetical protein
MLQLTERGKFGLFVTCFLVAYVWVSNSEIQYCIETGICP